MCWAFNSIANDGTIKKKNLAKLMAPGDPTMGFHPGGFALGFLLGLIGVLISYVIGGDQDVKRNRTKWSWIVVGVLVVIVLLAAI